MTLTWMDIPGLFPLPRRGQSNEAPSQNKLRMSPQYGEEEDTAAALAGLRQNHEGDFLLLAIVLLFLVGSYLVCRCRWMRTRNGHTRPCDDTHRGHPYTMLSSTSNDRGERKQTGSLPATSSSFSYSTRPNHKKEKTKTASKTVLVSEMEEPFLGPPDYEQPPPYEMSPPAYDYLPSAPPLSDDAEHHSPTSV